MIDGMIIFKSIINGFFQCFQYLFVLFIPIIFCFIIVIIMVIFYYIKKRYVEHIVPIKSDVLRQKKTSFFKNIFILFPKQFATDMLEQNPNSFDKFGIHMVVGEQGTGKTVTVVYLLQEWAKKYPKMEIFTNMCYKHENGELKHWKELIEHDNGIFGVVNVIDEIKTWFSNKDSKDVPAEMLGEICQQRKQKKAIVGTAQVFSEIAKPFRSQTHHVYIPKTFFGCLTIVRITKAKYYDSEKDKFRKYCGFFLFAHTKELRNAYDTYKKIEKYKDIEFSSVSSEYFSQERQAPPLVEVSFADFQKKRK